MGRIEYYDDPNAPQPNSLAPAAAVFVQDDAGRVLMVQRSDDGLWALPGGGMDIGETLGECAEREVLEVTGYQVHVVDVIGVYSDPKHIIAYSGGEVRQQLVICFRALLVSGDSRTDEEAPQLAWLDPVSLDELPMHPSTRLRVHHGLERMPHAHIG
jgi:ADP-ribose pyrophosphatase YjhB (NUDIX family)